MPTIATDDKQIELYFTPIDADKVPVPANGAAVTVAVQDAAGNDLSKWITVTPAPTADQPFKFAFSRKSDDDDSQPDQIDFFAVGTVTVNGAAITAKSDQLGFAPAGATTLAVSSAVAVPLTSAS